jgi:hypothetical protein
MSEKPTKRAFAVIDETGANGPQPTIMHSAANSRFGLLFGIAPSRYFQTTQGTSPDQKLDWAKQGELQCLI